ncbi:osteoglycin, paralog b [Syngnathoides biaculeatus]|uniref:osteoglycin, paralog b n=1 Tax=Syngnathoides biaculeatus TaxID=300417 RepID=UPI002ADDEB35|nr:osteoglycin, paralog b [Syngnathoides biaculeatus]
MGVESNKGEKVQSDVYDHDILQDTDQAVVPKAIGETYQHGYCYVCLSGSVYCEDVSPEMSAVPSLPKETAYLYARFNKITTITNQDFSDTISLKTIDLSWNLIAELEDGAFSRLANFEELNLSHNRLTKLPTRPVRLTSSNANFNKLTTQGVKSTAFKDNKIKTVTDKTFCQGNTSYYIRANMH